MSEPLAEDTLAHARTLLDRGGELGTTASRATALLGRTALEQAIWSLFPQLRSTSGRVMLLVLDVPLPNVSRQAALAWNRLSAASHHHAYEMPLTTVELDHLLDLVDDVIAAIRERQARRRADVPRATGR